MSTLKNFGISYFTKYASEQKTKMERSVKNIIVAFFLVSGLLYAHELGLKRDPIKHKNFLKRAVKHLHVTAPVVPGKYDLSPMVSPPEDQGNCGSCWSFSLTKALRSALMLDGRDPNVLAFNYLLNNCGPGTRESGCGGGDFEAGDNFLGNAGPWLNSQDPYTEREGACKKDLSVSGTALSFIVVGDGSNPPSFQQLAESISQNHMLSVDVAVCGAWESYSGGVFSRNECGARSINHMINMNGYDCESSVDANGNCVFDASGQPKNGDGFLVVMNNWGNSWGEKGYMRSKWGVDALATTAMYFVVSDSAPIPPKPDCSGFLCRVLGCWLPWCTRRG